MGVGLTREEYDDDIASAWDDGHAAGVSSLDEVLRLARGALTAANPHGEPWRCEAFAALDQALLEHGV